MRKLLAILALSVLLMSGCGAEYRRQFTSFIPKQCAEDITGSCYTFIIQSGSDSPLNSKDAENRRMEILEMWLKDNNLSTDNYKILSRTPVQISKGGLFSDEGLHNIYYSVAAY